MFVAITQLYDWLVRGQPHYFLLLVFWSWVVVWASKVIPAFWYRNWVTPFEISASVIIPVVSEPIEHFEKVLDSIKRQRPEQIIVVANGPYDAAFMAACMVIPGIRLRYSEEPNKRRAIMVGLREITSAITVIVDSDTIWTDDFDGTLAELKKPFADPKIGGVTTYQRIYNPNRNRVTQFADWLEGVRWLFGPRAQSAFGQVGVLPGRTIALRTSILRNAKARFLDYMFLGIHLLISDDKDLTMITQEDGYKTVLQDRSRVLTDCPTTWKGFWRQQYRWGKGNAYSNLRWWPMMIRRMPFALYHFVVETLGPFLLIGVIVNNFLRIAPGVFEIQFSTFDWAPRLFWLCLSAIGMYLNAVIPNLPLIRREPHHLLKIPMYMIASLFVLAPMRIIGLATASMPIGARWGTRKGTA